MHSLQLILSNKRYFSVVWVFTSLNIMIGTWVLYIPKVKGALFIDDAQIGFAMFCLALGLLFLIPLTPWLTKKIGLGKCTFFGICLFALAFTFPVIAPNYELLCIALFIVGSFSGFTDIAMNTLVSQLERQDNVNFMSSAHGFFSLGGAIGALIGTMLMPLFNNAFYHTVSMMIFIIITNTILVKYYFRINEIRQGKHSQKLPLKHYKPLLILAFLALVIMGNEGAIEHWSSIYLNDVVKVFSENLTGLGFTVFSICMTVGRFFGDGISTKIGSLKTIALGCLLGVFGYSFVLIATFLITIIGYGIIGLGLSVIVPELIRLAGQVKGVDASKSISFVSGVGFLGFLLGPISLGYISKSFNLKISFAVLLGALFLSLVLTIFKLNKN